MVNFADSSTQHSRHKNKAFLMGYFEHENEVVVPELRGGHFAIGAPLADSRGGGTVPRCPPPVPPPMVRMCQIDGLEGIENLVAIPL